jgi:hypothetical protein
MSFIRKILEHLRLWEDKTPLERTPPVSIPENNYEPLLMNLWDELGRIQRTAPKFWRGRKNKYLSLITIT